MIRGFSPIAGPDARVLVLGTCPSRASLDAGEYYAHSRNAFWPIMERLFACGERLDYSARRELLITAGVALWDVLHAAERETSLDSDIVRGSEVANDIGAFLREHQGVRVVFFNGAMAEKLFLRHVASVQEIPEGTRMTRLPSTSPAHAGMTFEAKCTAWTALREALDH